MAAIFHPGRTAMAPSRGTLEHRAEEPWPGGGVSGRGRAQGRVVALVGQAQPLGTMFVSAQAAHPAHPRGGPPWGPPGCVCLRGPAHRPPQVCPPGYAPARPRADTRLFPAQPPGGSWATLPPPAPSPAPKSCQLPPPRGPPPPPLDSTPASLRSPKVLWVPHLPRGLLASGPVGGGGDEEASARVEPRGQGPVQALPFSWLPF